jgi:hypothetical protein
MGSATSSSMPQKEVDALINQIDTPIVVCDDYTAILDCYTFTYAYMYTQVSDAYGLEVASRAAAASRAPVQQQQQEAEEAGKGDELEKRLAALRAA